MSLCRLHDPRIIVACAMVGLLGMAPACGGTAQPSDEQNGEAIEPTCGSTNEDRTGPEEGPAYPCPEPDDASEQSAVVAQELVASDIPVPADIDSCGGWSESSSQQIADALNAAIRGRVPRRLLAIAVRARCDTSGTLGFYVLPIGGPWKSLIVTQFAMSPMVVGPDDGELPDDVTVLTLSQTEEPPPSGI